MTNLVERTDAIGTVVARGDYRVIPSYTHTDSFRVGDRLLVRWNGMPGLPQGAAGGAGEDATIIKVNTKRLVVTVRGWDGPLSILPSHVVEVLERPSVSNSIAVTISSPATYAGIKERRVTLGESRADGPEIIMRQTAKGSKDWFLINRYYDGTAENPLSTQVHSRILYKGDLKSAKTEAIRLMTHVAEVSPGGKITFTVELQDPQGKYTTDPQRRYNPYPFEW